MLPLETAATGTLGGAAPFAIIEAKGFAAADASLGICADVSTSPIELSIHPLASIISLAVVKYEEEKEEVEQQPATPCCKWNISLDFAINVINVSFL